MSGDDRGQMLAASRQDPSTRLTATSYIVLGMLDLAEPATPYDLKRFAQISTVNFWSVPHSQLYKECARLASEGLLSEEQEQTGRRRRVYRMTQAGREALNTWRSAPTEEFYEARDPGILKLFFGGDQAILAASQLKLHQHQLSAFEQFLSDFETMPSGMRLALQAGVEVERVVVGFWARVAEEVSS